MADGARGDSSRRGSRARAAPEVTRAEAEPPLHDDRRHESRHGSRRRKRSRHRSHARPAPDRWIKRAVFAFALVGAVTIWYELWRFNAGDGHDTSPRLEVVGDQPATIGPGGVHADPRLSIEPTLRLDPTMPPEPARPLAIGGPDGAVERCVIDGAVVYVSPDQCRGGTVRPAIAPAGVPRASGEGLSVNQQEALRRLDAVTGAGAPTGAAPATTPSPAR